MGDAKLFRIGSDGVSELPSSSYAIERSLQSLIEQNLQTFFSIRLLRSEYSTGKAHGGRIDTIGLDENSSPVILEYKRSTNDNVISQGLFYLDWLLDHKGEFKVLVQETLGHAAADGIDWSSPRVICIAADFTKYDEHAVKQMGREIELVRYRKYGEEFLMLEMASSPITITIEQPKMPKQTVDPVSGSKHLAKSVSGRLESSSTEVKSRFERLENFLLSLGDDVQKKVAQDYFAYRRLKNFACVEVHPQLKRVTAFVNSDFIDFVPEENFTRDVRKIGHYGTGGLEISMFSDFDVERAKPLIEKSYGLG